MGDLGANPLLQHAVSNWGHTISPVLPPGEDKCWVCHITLVLITTSPPPIWCGLVLLQQVKLKVFLTYMSAIGPVVSICIVIFYIMNYTCSVSANFWLSAWSNDADNATVSMEQRDMRLGVYGALGLAQGWMDFVHFWFVLTSFADLLFWNVHLWVLGIIWTNISWWIWPVKSKASVAVVLLVVAGIEMAHNIIVQYNISSGWWDVSAVLEMHNMLNVLCTLFAFTDYLLVFSYV